PSAPNPPRSPPAAQRPGPRHPLDPARPVAPSRHRRIPASPSSTPWSTCSAACSEGVSRYSSRSGGTAMSLNLALLLRQSATNYPQKTALSIGDTDLTYETVHGFVRRFAGALGSLGVEPGEHLAVLL